MTKPSYVPPYYRLPNSDKEYLCSTIKDNGLHRCQDLPPLRSTDMSTICQNTLPNDWKQPKPIFVTITHGYGNDTWKQQKHEDRFIDGELVPYDLVPGDESSPFLVKQMSPFIAQSVFQPAYAPKHLDSLPSVRQKRETSSGEKKLNDHLIEKLTNNNNNSTLLPLEPLKSSETDDKDVDMSSSIDLDGNKNDSKVKIIRTTINDLQQSLNQSRRQQYQSSHKETNHNRVTIKHEHKHHKLGERIRTARFAGSKLSSRKSSIIEGSSNKDDPPPMVETNANSDQFDRISQAESMKGDKSNRKYYLGKKNNKASCINWNKYYTECRAGDGNPFQGTISFDNVGMAWTTIFLVISLEGWSDIMYLLQDSHSFWVWIYFVLLIVIGSFFMINLCLVVIATQFSATKKREMERMRQERLKFSSSSTLTATTESTNCYTVIVKSIARCLRRLKYTLINKLKRRKCRKLHKKRLLERQKYSESHQITGIHSERKKQKTKYQQKHEEDKINQRFRGVNKINKIEESTNSGHSNRDESELTNQELNQVSAASKRSSWRRSSRTARRNQDEVDEKEDEKQQMGRDLPQASDDQLVMKHRASMKRDVTNDDDDAASAAATDGLKSKSIDRFKSSKRSIKLDHYECGPSCRAAKRSSSNRKYGKDVNSSKRLHSSCRHYHECDLEEVNIYFCPKFIYENEKLQRIRLKLNQNIKQLVDHRYFQRLILLAILINAISMGIEYHNQPEQLTEAVEISNIVFACLFLIEMILKLIAHGLYNYVIDGFNCFDGCIVILSILELFESSSGSGLSVLRTFRLLRILKLVRFMPALRRQLVIMLRTLDNVAVFFALLVLFIFIFSILGMNLFGCKFCETLPDGTERCDRKNFNSLLWSLVTVFQILTQEDWNVSSITKTHLKNKQAQPLVVLSKIVVVVEEKIEIKISRVRKI